jgi:hypothetical protein
MPKARARWPQSFKSRQSNRPLPLCILAPAHARDGELGYGQAEEQDPEQHNDSELEPSGRRHPPQLMPGFNLWTTPAGTEA